MNKTILIVEDNQDSAEMLCAAIEFWGYSPLVAYDGEEGFNLASSLPRPDLILSDFSMPRLKGDGLRLRLLESDLGKIPFILMTAMPSIPNIPEMLTVFKKPLMLNELKLVLDTEFSK